MGAEFFGSRVLGEESFLGAEFFGSRVFWEQSFLGVAYFGSGVFWGQSFLGEKFFVSRLFWEQTFLGVESLSEQSFSGAEFVERRVFRGADCRAEIGTCSTLYIYLLYSCETASQAWKASSLSKNSAPKTLRLSSAFKKLGFQKTLLPKNFVPKELY